MEVKFKFEKEKPMEGKLDIRVLYCVGQMNDQMRQG